MRYRMDEAMELLARTPALLTLLLDRLPPGWTDGDEGPDTWSPRQVVGHLIHGERADWIPRARKILEHGDREPFEPFDRFAHLEEARARSTGELLAEFARLRQRNLETLRGFGLAEADLDRPGRHPALGAVTLRQLLATWVAHDLNHVVQIARVMAKQYGEEVGPWRQYLSVLGDPRVGGAARPQRGGNRE